ncbi:RHS repeat protein, partial [Paenibacillus sp. GCM10012307]|nr:RHS repeat protein [Paenibacillus roseus]
MRKIIVYLLLVAFVVQLAPAPSAVAKGKSNIQTASLGEWPIPPVEESGVQETLTLEWLSRSFQIPELDLVEQLNKGYTLEDLYAALQARIAPDQSLADSLQQINPEVEWEEWDYSAARFENREAIPGDVDQSDISETDENVVKTTDELTIPDESLLHPAVTPDPEQGRMMAMSSSTSYPTSYDEFAVKRLNIQRDSAPFSIQSIGESISPISGSLSVQATDMVLPGRNGLSFALTRSYDSSDAQYYDKDFVSGIPYTRMYYPELEGRLYNKASSPNSLVSPQVGYAGNFVFDGTSYKSLVQIIGGQSTFVYYPRPNEPYFEFNNEVIDLLKSAWTYVDPNNSNSPYLLAQDMVLSGIPLNVRFYPTGNVVYDPYFQIQWANYVAYSNQAKPKQGENRFPIGKGWSWDIPYIETKDTNKKYIHLFGGSAYELDGLNLKGYPWKDLKLETGSFTTPSNSSAYYKLQSLDGKKMYFDYQGQLMEIADAYNNTLQFGYQSVQPYGTVLTKVKDALGNELTISYSTKEVVVTIGDRTVKYDKMKDPQGNKELLTQVTDAMGRKTQYVYDIKPIPFDLVGGGRPKDNFIALLKQVYHPTKARTDYGYTDFDRALGTSAKERAYRATSREDVVTYTDGSESKFNRVTYSYTGDGAAVRFSNSSFSTTVDNGRIQTTSSYDRVYIDENTPEVYYNTQVVKSSGTQQSTETMEYNRVKRWPVPTKVTAQTKQGSLQSTASIVSRDYDEYGNVITETDPYTNTTSYTYDTGNLLKSYTVPVQSNKSLFVELERYPTTNGIKTVKMKENNSSGPLKAQTSYVYDSYGNPTTITIKDDTRDIVVANEYDFTLYQAGFPTRQAIQVTGADNQTTSVAQQFR